MIREHQITDDAFGIFETDLPAKDYIDFFENWAANSMLQTNTSHNSQRKVTQGYFHDFNFQVEVGSGFLRKYNEVLRECVALYFEKFEHFKSIELQSIYLKVQKTNPSEGFHSWHCENANIKNLRRALATIVYLNDVEEGGETEFLYQRRRIAPKAGRFAIWPAGFPYIHRGNPPLSGSKYVLTSWLEYK